MVWRDFLRLVRCKPMSHKGVFAIVAGVFAPLYATLLVRSLPADRHRALLPTTAEPRCRPMCKPLCLSNKGHRPTCYCFITRPLRRLGIKHDDGDIGHSGHHCIADAGEAVMKAGMCRPAFIRLWKRSTTQPFSTSTMATSVARSPMAGDRPVVSKSITAIQLTRGIQANNVSPPSSATDSLAPAPCNQSPWCCR